MKKFKNKTYLIYQYLSTSKDEFSFSECFHLRKLAVEWIVQYGCYFAVEDDGIAQRFSVVGSH